MPFLGVALLLVQVACAVHAVKTGRDMRWVYIIVFVPALGSLLYFVLELLPDLRHSRSTRRMGSQLSRSINPLGEQRRLRERLDLSDTQQNRLALAEELVVCQQYQEAVELYQSCLTGIDASNPDIMLGLAQAQFHGGEAGLARATLERLIEANPDYKSSEGHLLYARALEQLGETEAALHEYEVLARSYPGEEGRCRYALLLRQMGSEAQAREVFQEILLRAKQAPKYVRKAQKPWIDIARSQLGA